MDLKYTKRTAERKCEANRLRRDGQIPAIIYVRNQAGETVSVDREAFTALLRTVQPGRLPTTVFTLSDGSKKLKAIL